MALKEPRLDRTPILANLVKNPALTAKPRIKDQQLRRTPPVADRGFFQVQVS